MARGETSVRDQARVALSHTLARRKMDYYVKLFTTRPAREEVGLQLADLLAGRVMREQAGEQRLPAELQVKLNIRHWP